MVNFTAGSVLTASALNTAFNAATIDAQTGTSFTFGTANAGELVTLNNASGGTATIPANSTWGAATGTIVSVMNVGTAGSFTIGTAAGVTLNAVSGTTVLAPLEAAVIVKLATNTWQMSKADSGPPGLVKITDSSFSAVSSVSINNCFSATYENYRLIVTTVASTASNISIRLRTGGTDNSTANYTNTGIYAGDGVSVSSEATSGNTSFGIGVTARARRARVFDILQPFASDRTYLCGINVEAADLASNIYVAGSIFQGTTSFDGFSLLPNTGTITGNLRVYGYRN